MSAIIKQLTDKEDANDLLPITNTKAVYDDAGNRLDNTLTNLTNLVNNKASANLVSDAYNPSKTYAAGEFCIYNNTLWKSKVDNNAGNTPAEGSYWTATKIDTTLNELNQNLKSSLNKKADKAQMLKFQTLTFDIGTVNSLDQRNGSVRITAPSEYRVLGVIGMRTNHYVELAICGFQKGAESGNIADYIYGIRNLTDVNYTDTFLYVDVVYAKADLF